MDLCSLLPSRQHNSRPLRTYVDKLYAYLPINIRIEPEAGREGHKVIVCCYQLISIIRVKQLYVSIKKFSTKNFT